jgi:HSP20 family protein
MEECIMRNELDFWRRDRGQRGLARFFDEMFQPLMNDRDFDVNFSPAVDIEESDLNYVLSFDIPGMKKDDIKIEMVGNQLMVSGERVEEKDTGRKGNRYTERRYGSFQRVFTLPQDIDANKIDANYENGVLSLTVPKSQKSQARQIKIGEGKMKNQNVPVQ